MALARAKNAKGERVGFSRATLAGDFAAVAKLVGVDANGEPNGTANEEARYIMDATWRRDRGPRAKWDACRRAGCRRKNSTA